MENRKLKKLIATLLVVVLLIAVIPMGAFTFDVNAATTLTEEQFATKLAAVKKEYPDNKYWNEYNGTTKIGSLNVAKAGNKICSGTSGGNTCVSNGYCARYGTCTCKCGSFHGGQCHGFANLVAYKIFGSYATNWTNASSDSDVNKNWEWHKSVSKYYAGDFVRLTTGHSIFIIKVTSSRVYTVDCNRTGPCQIDWNNSYTISEFKSKTKFVVRYKNNTLTGTGSTINKLTMQYNVNGGTLSNNLYTVTTDGDVGLWLRSSYNTSSDKLVLIPDDTNLTITETKTSGGYTWGKTTYNGKTGWCAISIGAVRTYYLTSNIVYKSVSKKAFTNIWNYGTGSEYGLCNYTTFGLSKKGYQFVGWSLSSDGSTTIFDQDDASLKAESIYPDVKNKDATVTLYAIWKPLQKTISNIEIVNMPKKTEYYIGDTLELDGLNLKINYTDGSNAIAEKYSVSDFDSSKEGTKTLKVSYGDVFTDFKVTVKEPSVKVQEKLSLAVGDTTNVIATADPSNAEIDYYSSDSSVFEVANGKLTAISNGTATLYCEITVNNNTYISKCVVKVGTGVKENNTDNRVDTKPVISSISIAEMPQKTEYKIGDQLDITGLKILLNYSDDSKETVEKGFSVSGFDSAVEGEKTLTVKYNDCTATYKITVYNSVTDRWQHDDIGWWYEYADGSYATGWAQIGNVWYYFDASGYMVTDWKVIDNSWYYFNASGAMLIGWQTIGDKQYYFNANGDMVSNSWIDNCYLSSSGAMIPSGTTGECYWKLDGTVLTISGDGEMDHYEIDNPAPWGTAVTQIEIADGVKSIGWGAFYNCSNLSSVIIPDSIKTIWDYAFRNCTALTNITIPSSVTSIGIDVFDNTGYYNNVDNWENDLLYLGDNLLGAKITISGFCTIKNDTKVIACGTFSNIKFLTKIIIPDSVINIDDAVFYNCSSLTSITIPDSVTSIGSFAFGECYNLTDVYYSGSKLDKSKITIDDTNDYLLNANWHYNHAATLGEWKFDNVGWWYQYSDGGYAIGWAQIGNVWYYFNASGYMVTDWQIINGDWYYFDGSGAMLTNCYVGGYWLTSSGAMATPSWQQDANGWWYSYGDGTYAIGWALIGSDWYYFNAAGYMVTSTWIDGYYLSASGAMA